MTKTRQDIALYNIQKHKHRKGYTSRKKQKVGQCMIGIPSGNDGNPGGCRNSNYEPNKKQ